MPRDRKTPQEKKHLELQKDHFTFSKNPHAFRKTWKRKKSLINREYRRKSDELLAKAKPQISAKDAESVVGDVTVAHLKESILRKRLQKWSTVTVGEKVKIKLQKREEMVGRRVNSTRHYDSIVKTAVSTLLELEGDQLTDTANRIARVLQGGDPVEWMRLYRSRDRLDRAIYFVERLARGDAFYIDALRRDQALCESFQLWKKNANRLLAKQRRPVQKKLEEKAASQKRVKALVRQNRQT